MDTDCAYDSYPAHLKGTAKAIAADDDDALLKSEMALVAPADTWIAKEVADKWLPTLVRKTRSRMHRSYFFRCHSRAFLT